MKIEGFRSLLLVTKNWTGLNSSDLNCLNIPYPWDDECCLCGLCEEACPTGAMNAESGTADMEKCIVCLRCMSVCPEDALHIKDLTPAWPYKLANHKITEDDLKGLQSKLFL